MNKISRKSFLKLSKNILAALGMGAILTPIVAFFYPSKLEEVPSEPVSAGHIDEIPPGTSKTIRFGRYPAIVIHTTSGLKAYSAVCTHFACITKWDASIGQIVCPCHEGYFDPEDGSVLSGPPPTSLESLSVYIEDTTIFVSAGGDA